MVVIITLIIIIIVIVIVSIIIIMIIILIILLIIIMIAAVVRTFGRGILHTEGSSYVVARTSWYGMLVLLYLSQPCPDLFVPHPQQVLSALQKASYVDLELFRCQTPALVEAVARRKFLVGSRVRNQTFRQFAQGLQPLRRLARVRKGEALHLAQNAPRLLLRQPEILLRLRRSLLPIHCHGAQPVLQGKSAVEGLKYGEVVTKPQKDD